MSSLSHLVEAYILVNILFNNHSAVKCEMLGGEFLTQPRFPWEENTFPLPFHFSTSDSVDGEQLLLTLPRVEVREGLPVGLGNHREDEKGVEGRDDGKVEEDSVRTKQRHERLSELEKDCFDIFKAWHLDGKEDESKLGGDQSARDQRGEVSRKPLALQKAKVDQVGKVMQKPKVTSLYNAKVGRFAGQAWGNVRPQSGGQREKARSNFPLFYSSYPLAPKGSWRRRLQRRT